MHEEAHCYDFQDELEGENVTENLADLLESLVVGSLVISIVVVTNGEQDRVKED